MEHSTLIELLKTLTHEEMSEFVRFVKANLVKVSRSIESIGLLVGYFAELHPEFNPDKLDKILISRKVFKDENVIEGKVEKYMVEIHKVLKSYLLFKHVNSNQNEIKFQLEFLKVLQNRGLRDRQIQLFNKIKVENDKNKLLYEDYYLDNYLFNLEYHRFLSDNNKQKDDLGIIDAINSLNLLYYYSLIELINRFNLQRMVINLEYPDFMNNFFSLDIPQYVDVENNLLLRIVKYINNLLSADIKNLENYKEFRNVLKESENLFELSLNKKFAAYVRNLYVILFNKSNDFEYKNELFTIQRNHLTKGYMYNDFGKIFVSSYVSIAYHGIGINEIEWADEFIEGHRNKIIGQDELNNYYKLMKSVYYVQIKKYQDALDVLPNSFEEATYNAIQKQVEIKAYYGLNSPLLSFKIDAYKMFVSRVLNKKLLNEIKIYTINFLNIINQLINTTKGDRKRAEKIIHRIHEKKFVSEKSWLIAKAKELGGIKD